MRSRISGSIEAKDADQKDRSLVLRDSVCSRDSVPWSGPMHASKNSICSLLLQFRILRFGFLKDGDVGVSVLPEGKEIFVGSQCPYAGGIGVRSF
jgi:hypothetical protein